MQIKDFKIYSFKDSWENYPFPAEESPPELIGMLVPEIKSNIEGTQLYKWKLGGEVYAFIYAIQLRDKPQKEGNSISVTKKNILDEEVYFIEIPISYEEAEENLKLYIFDEDKFIFIVGGLWSFPEELIKKLIKKYPENPTKLKIGILPINERSFSLTKFLSNFS